MKIYKAIIIAAAAFLSWPMAAHADSCNTSMEGELEKLTIRNDSRFFAVSFGEHQDVPVWHNLGENLGRQVFSILQNAAVNGAVLQVQSCESGNIRGMSIKRRGR